MISPLTLHLFKTDCRRNLGWLAVFAASCLLQACLGILKRADMAETMASNFTFLGQLVLGGLLIVTTMHGDALSKTTAGWKTRPITRKELFQAKLLYIGGIVQGGFLLSLVPGWLAAGFNATQFLSSLAQWTIWSAVPVWSVAAGAAWSYDFKSLATRVGMMACGIIAVVALNRLVDLPVGRRAYGHTMGTSILIMSLLAIAAGAVASWTICVFRSRTNLAMVTYAGGLLLAMLVAVGWQVDLLAHQRVELKGTQISVIEDLSVTNDVADDEQLLWTHFRTKDLPTNTLLVPSTLRVHFKSPAMKAPITVVHNTDRYYSEGASMLFQSPASGQIIRRLSQFFPQDTLWFGRLHSHDHTHLPIGNTEAKALERGTKGRFHGTLGVRGIQLERFADIPLRPRASYTHNGVSVQIRALKNTESGKEVHIREHVPQLWWSDRPEWTGARYYKAFCLYVIYDPTTGEAWPSANQHTRRRVSAPWHNTRQATIKISIARSSLQDRLAGKPSGDSGELRLHVFMPREIGRSWMKFELPEYAWAEHRNIKSPRQRDVASISDMADLRWPGMSDPDAARKYVDDLLNLLPQRTYGDVEKLAREKLMAIGGEGLPILLERIPVRSGVRYSLVDRVVRELATRDHLPAMLAALERSPEFARMFSRKRWEAEAADLLLQKLSERRIPLPVDVLAIAARFARPEHYDDLQWHFIHNRGESIYALPLLEKLPGFPMEQTVHARWKRHLVVERNDNGIRAYAARQGEPGALAEFVMDLEYKSLSRSREKQLLAVVQDAVEFSGDEAALKAWLSENLEQLKFDPTTKRYRQD